jgi:hypothetical protein
MTSWDQPFDKAQEPEVCLSKASGSVTTTPELTVRQKIMMVFVTVLSSFAVGSIPVVYAFTVAPTDNQTTTQTTTQTPIPRGEMF